MRYNVAKGDTFPLAPGPLPSALNRRYIMVTQKDIDRINELARKSKTEGLTVEEKAEQKALRIKYIEGFKASLIGQLDSITVVEPDGSKHKLSKKDEPKS